MLVDFVGQVLRWMGLPTVKACFSFQYLKHQMLCVPQWAENKVLWRIHATALERDHS